MVVSPYFGGKSHASNGQNVSFKEPKGSGPANLAAGLQVGRDVGRQGEGLAVRHELELNPMETLHLLLGEAKSGNRPFGGVGFGVFSDPPSKRVSLFAENAHASRRELSRRQHGQPMRSVPLPSERT